MAESRTITCDCGVRIPVESWWSVTCDKCGAEFNGAGQRLRSDWRGNPSVYDDEIGDLEGFELQHADY